MIRSLSAIFAVCVLLAGAAIFERLYVDKAFADFHVELTSLYEKTDEGRANYEDARAVQTAWEARKERLQIFLPHNDVARVDNYLAETVRLVAEGDYAPAQAGGAHAPCRDLPARLPAHARQYLLKQ